MRGGLRLAAAVAAIVWVGSPVVWADGFGFSGFFKPQYVLTTYPDDSLFRELTGSEAHDLNGQLRLNLSWDRGPWDLRADYQLVGLFGDWIEVSREFPPELQLLFGRLQTDERRLFDLTHVLEDSGRSAVLHRLDRLSVGHTGRRGTVRFGRQAVSWGNGLVYTPMDIFNPFDPAAVDKEYKTGDDMVYGQLLRDSGEDVQSVLVFRRNLVTGDVEADASSLALKYHGFVGAAEYDLLAAQHVGDPLLGFGGNVGVGGAVVSGDATLAFTDDDTVPSFVVGTSMSWVLGGKNVSGVVEYFYNGFGQSDGDYSPEALAANPELLQRFARGELFTLGRHYLTASAMVEITPLFLLTPNVFFNLRDPSALIQIVTQNDLRQDLVLLGAINVPAGATGTEYGGLPTVDSELFLSSGPSLFVQLAWYF